MRFLVDECSGPAGAEWLSAHRHDVFSVYEQAREMDDDAIIHKAYIENWILITNDRDFGEKVFRERRPHRGVILLRLDDERVAKKIDVLRRLLENYGDRLADSFVVSRENSRPYHWQMRSSRSGDPQSMPSPNMPGAHLSFAEWPVGTRSQPRFELTLRGDHR